MGLLPDRLTVKTGGHPDQLSRKIIGLDLYRIYAMISLLQTMTLTREQWEVVRTALRERVRLYAQGCIKRDRGEEAQRVWRLASPYLS